MVFGCCNHEGTTNAVRTDANVVVGDDDGEHQQSTVLTNPRRFEPTKERMHHLVIIGDITPNSVRLWVKVPNGGTWAVSLSKQSFRAGPAGSDLANMENESTEVYLTSKLGPDGFVMQSVALDEDEKNTGRLTHCFEFTGLDEDTKYHYILAAEVDTDAGEGWKRAVIGCDNTDTSKEHSFRTAKSSYSSINFAAYSCHDPYSWKAGEAYEGIWPEMAKLRDTLDLTIGGGDQIYVDSNEVAMTDLWTFLRENKFALRSRYLAQDGSLDKDGITDYLRRLIREYYQIYWNYDGIRDVYGRVPSYMVWDDHEIMDGWGSLNRKERVDKLKQKGKMIMDDEHVLALVDCTWHAAADVYDEYQHCHNPGPSFLVEKAEESVSGYKWQERCDPKDFAWDFSFRRGDEYRFYVTDMRGAHDSGAAEDRLYGPRQHHRLKRWLDGLGEGRVPARVAFITVPVPVVHWAGIVEYSQYVVKTLKDDLMDGWGHPTNHNERGKLLRMLFDASERCRIPIVLISGDVHCASAYILKDKDNYPNARIIQITSSSVSRKPVPSGGTVAFARTGHMTRRKNDGKGKEVKTSIHCQQKFANAGVVNFVVIGAEESNVRVKFYYAAKGGKLHTSDVDVMS